MEDVRLGTLDFTLTKPVDAQVLISVRQVEVWKLVDVVVGFVVLAVAIAQLGATVGPAEALAFLVALLAGVTIIYSFLLILATCVFWFIRLDNILNIFQSMYEAGKWPIGIYPPWLRTMLTFLVPIGFAITVPAEDWSAASPRRICSARIALAIVLPLLRVCSGGSASATTRAPLLNNPVSSVLVDRPVRLVIDEHARSVRRWRPS